MVGNRLFFPVLSADEIISFTIIYLFYREGTTWTEIDKVTGDSCTADDRFGFSVGISSHSAIVGAPYYTDNTVDTGAAFILSGF